jgi:hypothetical protein
MNFILEYYREWSDQRFLKRHGCETREEYDRKYDPDVVHRATRIKNFYHGYPYVYCFEDHNHNIYVWEVNELGGGDHVFFACQDPRDYTLFLLRWS